MTRLTNPTQTTGIELRWLREIKRRWSEFLEKVLYYLDHMPELTALNAEEWRPVPSQIRIYMEYLQREIDNKLLETEVAPNWQAVYQIESYKRGIQRSRAELRRQGMDLQPTIEEIHASMNLTPAMFTATPSIISSAVIPLAPIHQEALNFVYTRSYNRLKGHTDAMAERVRGVLMDATAQGKGIREIKKSIVDEVGITKRQAELIARTETIQAYQRSQINSALEESEDLGEEIKLRWVARLIRTRELHAKWHGDVITTEEAAKRVTISPYNCQCSLEPVIEEADTPARKARYAAEKRQYLQD